MPFARFGRTAACSRGDGKKIWRMAAHEGHLGRLAVRAYLVALAATLGGCSASEVVQNLPPANAIDLAQPNYRRVVADNVRAIRLSTRASESSSINATSRRLSLSTCRRLPPEKGRPLILTSSMVSSV